VSEHIRAHPNLVRNMCRGIRKQNVFSDLIRSNDPFAFARGYKFNVAPVSDNAPFFFFTLKIGQVIRKAWPTAWTGK
jgi:hypothetical protein